MKLRDLVANSLPRVRGRKKKSQGVTGAAATVSFSAVASSASVSTSAPTSSTTTTTTKDEDQHNDNTITAANATTTSTPNKNASSSRSHGSRASRQDGNGNWFQFGPDSRFAFLEKLVGKESPVKRLFERHHSNPSSSPPPYPHHRPSSSSSSSVHQGGSKRGREKEKPTLRKAVSSDPADEQRVGGGSVTVSSPSALADRPVFYSQHASPVCGNGNGSGPGRSEWDCSSLYYCPAGGYAESVTSYDSTPGSARGVRSRSRIRTNPWLPSPRPGPYSVRSLSSPCASSSRSPSPASSPAPPSSSDSATSPFTSHGGGGGSGVGGGGNLPPLGSQHPLHLHRHRRHRRHNSEIKVWELTRHAHGGVASADGTLTDTEQSYSTLDSGIGEAATSPEEKERPGEGRGEGEKRDRPPRRPKEERDRDRHRKEKHREEKDKEERRWTDGDKEDRDRQKDQDAEDKQEKDSKPSSRKQRCPNSKRRSVERDVSLVKKPSQPSSSSSSSSPKTKVKLRPRTRSSRGLVANRDSTFWDSDSSRSPPPSSRSSDGHRDNPHHLSNRRREPWSEGRARRGEKILDATSVRAELLALDFVISGKEARVRSLFSPACVPSGDFSCSDSEGREEEGGEGEEDRWRGVSPCEDIGVITSNIEQLAQNISSEYEDGADTSLDLDIDLDLDLDLDLELDIPNCPGTVPLQGLSCHQDNSRQQDISRQNLSRHSWEKSHYSRDPPRRRSKDISSCPGDIFHYARNIYQGSIYGPKDVSPRSSGISGQDVSPHARDISREDIFPRSSGHSRQDISPHVTDISKQDISPHSRDPSREDIFSRSSGHSRQDILSHARDISRQDMSSHNKGRPSLQALLDLDTHDNRLACLRRNPAIRQQQQQKQHVHHLQQPHQQPHQHHHPPRRQRSVELQLDYSSFALPLRRRRRVGREWCGEEEEEKKEKGEQVGVKGREGERCLLFPPPSSSCPERGVFGWMDGCHGSRRIRVTDNRHVAGDNHQFVKDGQQAANDRRDFVTGHHQSHVTNKVTDSHQQMTDKIQSVMDDRQPVIDNQQLLTDNQDYVTEDGESLPTVDVAVQTDFVDPEDEENSSSDWLASTESGSDWLVSTGSGSDCLLTGGGSGCVTDEEEGEEEDGEEPCLYEEGSKLWIVPDIMQNSTDTGYSSLSRDGRLVTDADNNNNNNNNNNNSSSNNNNNNNSPTDNAHAPTTSNTDASVNPSTSFEPSDSTAAATEVLVKRSTTAALTTCPRGRSVERCDGFQWGRSTRYSTGKSLESPQWDIFHKGEAGTRDSLCEEGERDQPALHDVSRSSQHYPSFDGGGPQQDSTRSMDDDEGRLRQGFPPCRQEAEDAAKVLLARTCHFEDKTVLGGYHSGISRSEFYSREQDFSCRTVTKDCRRSRSRDGFELDGDDGGDGDDDGLRWKADGASNVPYPYDVTRFSDVMWPFERSGGRKDALLSGSNRMSSRSPCSRDQPPGSTLPVLLPVTTSLPAPPSPPCSSESEVSGRATLKPLTHPQPSAFCPPLPSQSSSSPSSSNPPPPSSHRSPLPPSSFPSSSSSSRHSPLSSSLPPPSSSNPPSSCPASTSISPSPASTSPTIQFSTFTPESKASAPSSPSFPYSTPATSSSSPSSLSSPSSRSPFLTSPPEASLPLFSSPCVTAASLFSQVTLAAATTPTVPLSPTSLHLFTTTTAAAAVTSGHLSPTITTNPKPFVCPSSSPSSSTSSTSPANSNTAPTPLSPILTCPTISSSISTTTTNSSTNTNNSRSLSEVCASLEDKVLLLKRGKRAASRKLREAREEESLRVQHKLRLQRLLDLQRKRVLLQTLQDLRQRLQWQSARLQASYSAVLDLQKRCV